MPKSRVTKAKSKGRSKPYATGTTSIRSQRSAHPITPTNPESPKPAVNTRSATKKVAEAESNRSRFTELPLEIRLQVYGYFAHCPSDLNGPHNPVLSAEEWKEIKVTRRSLLLVSHQVSDEWTPVFFCTTSLLVRSPPLAVSSARSKNKNQDDSGEDLKAAISRLAKVLLEVIPVSKLRYVRRLEFHHHRPCPRNGKIMNDDGLIYLADILGHVKSNLPHLTSVTFVLDWVWSSFVSYKHGADDDHDGAFAFVDDKGRIEELAQRMLRDRRGAILRGWSVEKKPLDCRKLLMSGFNSATNLHLDHDGRTKCDGRATLKSQKMSLWKWLKKKTQRLCMGLQHGNLRRKSEGECDNIQYYFKSRQDTNLHRSIALIQPKSRDVLAVRIMPSIDFVTVDLIYDLLAITCDDDPSDTSDDSKKVRDRIVAVLKDRLSSNLQLRHDNPDAFINAKARVKFMVAEENMQSQFKQMSESLAEAARKLEKTLTASCNVQESTNTPVKTPGSTLLAQREKRKRDYEDLDGQFNSLEQLRKKWKSARATVPVKQE
ncbi:hypothetical protein H2202_008510 [Exophiala xenobiotica]|nr:hypothetical protein H2202_008510 [Exophiala xenobiotica]KAK5384300.1 hypothetical protein LTS13_002494 [Exophiala xenobiotica]KAK5399380.1 hypothetical protein LTR79_003016 [Exophiala xenobiotica]KAK5416533.1 hypothetical protein LTR90_005755 [Exophiala xenobiotica]KAK5457812.1 hypothetical protein LTR20_008558 [Exophiala xenobiotica]